MRGLLARGYGTIEAFMTAMEAAAKDVASEAWHELTSLGGIGDIVAGGARGILRRTAQHEGGAQAPR